MAIALTLASCAADPGSPLTPDPGVAVATVGARGICMCATCFSGEFCQVTDPAMLTGQYFVGRDACDLVETTLGLAIERAERVSPLVALDPDLLRRSRFADFQGLPSRAIWCLAPPDTRFAAFDDPLDCPSGSAERAALGNLDPCVHLPFDCRPITCFDPMRDARLPNASRCPLAGPSGEPGADRLICDSSLTWAAKLRNTCQTAELTEEAINQWDAHEPAAFCFLHCGGGLPEGAGAARLGCDPVLFDPPHVPLDSFRVRIGRSPSGDPSRVEVRIVRLGVFGSEDNSEVEGSLAITAPGCGPGVPCMGRLGLLELHALDSLRFEVLTENAELEDAQLFNTDLYPVVIEPIDATRSRVTLSAGTQLYITAIEGATTVGTAETLSDEVTGTLDWAARTFEASFTIVIGADTTTFTLHGQLETIAAVANAGPDQTLECEDGGAAVELSASSSFDPDPEQEIRGYTWHGRRESTFRSLPPGRETRAQVGLGFERFSLMVRDEFGAGSVDAMSVNVVDREPPLIEVLDLPRCLWPPDHTLRLLRLDAELGVRVRDRCTGEVVATRIVDAFSNESDDGIGDGSTAPDVLFNDTAVCLRAERAGPGRGRSYSVVVEASDASGNSSRQTLVVEVPHDMRPSTRCVGGATERVAEDDPRCSPPPPPPVAPPDVDGGSSAGAPAAPGSGCAASPLGAGGLGWALLAALVAWWRRRR